MFETKHSALKPYAGSEFRSIPFFLNIYAGYNLIITT